MSVKTGTIREMILIEIEGIGTIKITEEVVMIGLTSKEIEIFNSQVQMAVIESSKRERIIIIRQIQMLPNKQRNKADFLDYVSLIL